MKQREKGQDFLELQKYMLDYSRRKGFLVDWKSMPIKLLLLASEISEAAEAWRDQGNVEPLHNGKMMRKFIKARGLEDEYREFHKKEYKFKHEHADFREEIADILVRVFDICGIEGMDSYQEVMNKMEENERRPHKHGRTNH